MINSTHIITLTPITSKGTIDFTRKAILFHSSQVKSLYYNNYPKNTFTIVDFKGICHFFNKKYWLISLSVVDDKFLQL